MNVAALPRVLGLGFCLFALTAVPFGPLSAQRRGQVQFRVIDDSTLVQEVQLRDGTKLVGRIVAIDGDAITFRTLGGLQLEFQRRDAERVREIRGVMHGDDFWPNDPSDSRLFVAPTARVPRHGHGYFGIYELVVPSFAVGIQDVAMIAGGFSIIPGIAIADQVFYLAPKVQVFDTGPVQGAIGLFWVQPGTEFESAGLVYSGITAGNRSSAFSGGVAFSFESHGGFNDDPLLILGGETRVSRGVKLITENWFAPGAGDSVFSFGVRIIGSRITVEAAAVTSSEGGFVLPLVNFSLTW